MTLPNSQQKSFKLQSGRGTIVFVPRGEFDRDFFMLALLQGKIAYNGSDRTLVFYVVGVISPIADVISGGENFDRQVWELSLS